MIQLFSGLFWTGEQAIKLGIADRVGSLNTLKRELKTDKAVNYTIEYSPFDSVIRAYGKFNWARFCNVIVSTSSI